MKNTITADKFFTLSKAKLTKTGNFLKPDLNTHKFLSVTFIIAILVLVSYLSPVYALEPHNEIKGLFNTPRDVVIKCLECHRLIAGEVLQSTHWTWKRTRTVNGKQIMYGKKDSLAGFAIDIASNPTRCLKCHISNEPGTDVFTTAEEADVDCLVCHDSTGRYAGWRRGKGLTQGDFEVIARNVGKPTPKNCMTCHFADCGLTDSTHADENGHWRGNIFENDVHMAPKANSLSCQGCHVQSGSHSFSRSMVNESNLTERGDGCSSCHTGSPHSLDTLNSHSAKISCRTCHIPTYANDAPAIISWNWLLSGKIDPAFQAISGQTSYLQDKNGFTTSRKIRPVYLWDDGSDAVYARGQRPG